MKTSNRHAKVGRVIEIFVVLRTHCSRSSKCNMRSAILDGHVLRSGRYFTDNISGAMMITNAKITARLDNAVECH
jgi:hypothetical protein